MTGQILRAGASGGDVIVARFSSRILRTALLLSTALATTWLPSAATAATYYVSDPGQLNDAILAANASSDASSTIILTQSFTYPNSGVNVPTKPITIDTQGFTLSSAPNAGLAINGAGAIRTLVGTFAGTNGGTSGTAVQIRNGASVTNMGLIQGGTNTVVGGPGVDLGGPTAAATLTNYGVVRGGPGATGGAGVLVRNSSGGTNLIVNAGTIEGGNGSAAIATNSAAVTLNIVNSGTIRAGSGAANAITLTSGSPQTGVIQLELQDGSQIFGNVVANATAITDTLKLSGTGSNTTDISQYKNFDSFTKTGTGTWTLTGTTTETTPWLLDDGYLAVSSDGALGATAGTLTFDGGGLMALASFESTRHMRFTGDGIFNVVGGAELTLSGLLDGPGGLTKNGSGTLIQKSARSYAGATAIADGTLKAGATNVFSGLYATTSATGTLDLGGFNQTISDLSNSGAVRFGTAPGTTLTISNAYTGVGGTIYVNTALGDDSSATDLLDVKGSTSGTTSLVVNNVGGAGALTVEGIKLVNVDGASNGTFSLVGDYVYKGDQAVVGGAYAYRLYQGSTSVPGDGDWYLRSALIDVPDPDPLYQAGVPIYEAYGNVLQQSFSTLETLQQRVGSRAGDEAGGEGLWGRMVAEQSSFVPESSTTGATYDTTTWRLQAGKDGVISQSAAGRLVGGLSLEAGTISADIASIYGDGSISTLGFGGGATLTFYGNTGFYLDAKAEVKGFVSTLSSETAGLDLVANNGGAGFGFSLEAGQKIALTDAFSLTPQGQVAWSAVDFGDFTDAFGANVSLTDADRLTGRLGISADYQAPWVDQSGGAGSTHLYGIANLYYDFADGSGADVDGTAVASANDPLWGGLGLGGSVDWGDGLSLYGEAHVNASLDDAEDSNSLGATAGLRGKL